MAGDGQEDVIEVEAIKDLPNEEQVELIVGCCLDYIIHLFFVHIKPWAWVTELDR